MIGRAGTGRLCALALAGALAGAMPGDAATATRADPAAFATSFEPGQALPPAVGAGDWRADVEAGPPPGVAPTARARAGFSGLHALGYHGGGPHDGPLVLFDLDLPATAHTELSYLILPRRVEDDLRNPANYVALDLRFEDGSRLSACAARDQHRIGASARAQGEGRVLYPNQWNRVAIALGACGRGHRVRQVLLVHDGPAATFQGWIDDLRLGPAATDARRRPVEFVDTRRGSNANADYSRGNTFPAVAWPHGFNFWTPVTDASGNWLYQYQAHNGPDNRPRLQALALSHEPSPWMGDRQTLQLMPQARADGVPVLDRQARALGFDHADEVARPDYYRVRLDGGITAELVPTDHAAMFRFTFAGPRGQLLFDNIDDRGALTLDPSGRRFSGYSDVRSRLSAGATRLFFYGTVSLPVVASGRLAGGGRDHVAGWLGFDTARAHVLDVRVATSLISLAQARHNLALELPAGTPFGQVRARAGAAWNRLLGKVRVEGASAGERTTLYSNLYRLFLYPNEAFENAGTARAPDWRYASPFLPPAGADTPTRTGAAVRRGRPYVNNGFWDTYRTAWPAYVLLDPRQAGRMIDGFVQQYRDGGWIARWSSPGYADLMVGTSADVAFADAWLKGVRNFDVRAFYQAALKDASVVSANPGTGRKGLAQALFRGYTSTAVPEGLSWSMDGYINDFGLANLARALAARPPPGDPYAGHYADDAIWFGQRARDYVNLFDPAVRFFVGRDAQGSWRSTAADFDPLRWGGDYTETDAWNMAFHVPQDGAGLAALYGGRAALAARLDRFFATPGVFHVGSYGEPIHEMLEARDVRMGQYGHSNQPAHHILYMYDFAGEPWKTQDKVRDALSRLYVGSSIGQGYPGDEDNGEMSAWYLFSAAGFYPLRMGSPEYVIGAPYFPHLDIALAGGRHLVIDAPGVSDTRRYVQGLTVDGRPWHRLTLPHARIAQGAHLVFTMGALPSRWGSAPAEAPPSLSAAGTRPRPWSDLAAAADWHAGAGACPALSDGDADTAQTLPAVADVLVHLPQPRRARMLTVTSAAHGSPPPGWRVLGSDDGVHWRQLDRRRGERFRWPRQTRAFALGTPAKAWRWYRVQFDASPSGPWPLAELGLLGDGPPATSRTAAPGRRTP